MSEFLKKAVAAGYKIEDITPMDIYSYEELVKKMREIPKRTIVSTGIPSLNKLIEGFEPGRLYVLSGVTKGGKTTLAQTIMFNMAKIGQSSLFFSYEMGWQEVVKKYMAMDGLQNSSGTPTKLPMYMPIELNRGGNGLQFDWIREAIIKAKNEQNIKLVVIDHLHFLLPLQDHKNLSFIIGGIVREIKKLSISLEIPILLLCHLQKDATKDDTAPSWTDIRDSSFIAQEADAVLIVWRGKEEDATKAAKKITSTSVANVYSRKSMLSVDLNRMSGDTGRVLLWHNGAGFEEYDNQDGKKYETARR
jgi:replicative DNA helicase